MRRKQWLTMAEYARQHGYCRSGIFRAVRTGRLESNGRTGRACRVRGEISGSSKISRPNDPIEEALQAARIEKIRLNTELQKLKNKETRDAMRRNVAEIFIEEYIRAFTPVKPWFASLQLDAAKLEKLRNLYDECTANFISAIRNRIDGIPFRAE